MLFGIIVYMFSLYTAGAGAVNISSLSDVAGSVLSFDTLSLIIFSDSNISPNALITSGLCPAILSVHGFYHNCFVCKYFSFTIPLLQDKPGDALPNITTLGLAQVAT